MGNFKKLLSPEYYYGEDEYKNILFFTQGKEAVKRYEAKKKLEEFEKTIQGKYLAMTAKRLTEEERKESELLEQLNKKVREND